MSLITRRRFVQQAAFSAAALYGRPMNVLAGPGRIFEAHEQKGAPLDAAAIRKLASEITGHVITPEAATMNRHAWSSTAHLISVPP